MRQKNDLKEQAEEGTTRQGATEGGTQTGSSDSENSLEGSN